MPFSNRFSVFLKSLDRFGRPMHLTYNQQSTFKTTFGGVLTIISRLAIVIYLIIELVSVVNKEKVTINTTKYQRNLFNDNTTIQLDTSNFDIGFHLEYHAGNNSLSEDLDTYFTISIAGVRNKDIEDTSDETGLGITIPYFTMMDLERCTQDRFRNDSITNQAIKLAGRFWCPKNFSTQLWGHMMGKERTLIQATVTLCNQVFLDQMIPGKKCKTPAESLAVLPLVQVVAVVMTNYIDGNEFNQDPIKNTFDVYSSFLNQYAAPINFYSISQNYAILQDSIFSSSLDNRNLTYIKSKQQSSFNVDPSILGIYNGMFFWTDPSVETTKRQVRTIFDLLSSAGGLMSVIILVCSVFAQRIQNILFFLDIIPRIYQVDQHTIDKLKIDNPDVKIGDSNKQEQDSDKQITDQSPKKQRQKQDEISSKIIKKKTNSLNESQRNFLGQENSQSTQISKILENRQQYYLSFKNWIMIFLRIKICPCMVSKRRKQVFQQQYKIFKKGTVRIERQIDIQYIIKSLLELKALAKLKLSEHEQHIIPNFKEFVLNDESSQDEGNYLLRKRSSEHYDKTLRKASVRNKSLKDKKKLHELLGINHGFKEIEQIQDQEKIEPEELISKKEKQKENNELPQIAMRKYKNEKKKMKVVTNNKGKSKDESESIQSLET